jgi:uncharacterized protein (TIGR02145 family)
MAENLDWKASGITVGTNAWYLNDDESTYGVNGNKYGLLYNYQAVDVIKNESSIPSGWRVPSLNDMNALISFVGVSNGAKLKSTTSWSEYGGTDDYGFDAKAVGYRDGNGYYQYLGKSINFWTTDYTSNDGYYMYLVYSDNDIHTFNYLKTTSFSIRLVKDAT